MYVMCHEAGHDLLHSPCYLFYILQARVSSSPLGRAAEMGHKEAVERLLVAGAVLDYQDKV